MTLETHTGSNVISLNPALAAEKRAGKPAKFPAIALVEAYWEGLRDTRLMPARSEVDPRGISAALEFAFVLEKIAPGMARLRVAGRHLSELLGMETRGMPVSAMFLPESRNVLRAALEECLDTPACIRLSLAGDTGFTRPRLEAQMYLAPLRDENGLPSRILGCLQSKGRIGRGPRRFSIRETGVSALLGEALPHGEARNRAGDGAQEPGGFTTPKKARDISGRDIPGLAEHATGFVTARRRPAPDKPGQGKPGLGKPGLRLVYSADA